MMEGIFQKAIRELTQTQKTFLAKYSGKKEEVLMMYSEEQLDEEEFEKDLNKDPKKVDGIPFDVRMEQPNAETLEAIAEVRAMKAGKLAGKSYQTADEMMEDLLK